MDELVGREAMNARDAVGDMACTFEYVCPELWWETAVKQQAVAAALGGESALQAAEAAGGVRWQLCNCACPCFFFLLALSVESPVPAKMPFQYKDLFQ